MARKIIAPISRVRDLVPVDSEPLRLKLWTQYQNALRRYEKAAAELRQFKEVDSERYQLWYEGEFADRIIKFRKSQAAVADLLSWVDQIKTYASVKDIPTSASFDILSKARDEGRLEELWQELMREAESGPKKKKKRRKETDHQQWESIEDMFHDIFEEAAASFDPGDRSFHRSAEAPAKTKTDPGTERSVKNLYHQLALRLHPDKNPEQTEEHRNLFHAAQAAYREQDIEALEVIWKRLEGSDTGPFAWQTAALGDIIRRKRSVDQRYSEINVELRVAKQNPGWNFSWHQQDKSTLKKLKDKARRLLDEQLEKIDEDWQRLNDWIHRFEVRRPRR